MNHFVVALFCYVIFSQISIASTFVGNGGQVGDLELAVTFKQISASINHLKLLKSQNQPVSICTCPSDYSDHQLCEVLSKLTTPQVQFCEKFVLTQLNKIEKALATAKIEWTYESLSVREENGQKRAADAITQKKENLIIIDQNRFVDFQPYKRTFLLIHELFHLDRFEDVDLNDEDQRGPFNQKYGTRELLNSAAAGLVLFSINETIFQKYAKTLRRSVSSKNHWFGLFSSSTSLEQDKTTTYSTSLSSGFRFAYRYEPSDFFNLGITVQSQTQSGDKKILTMTNLSEKRNLFTVGITYKYLPFKNLDPFNYFWNSFVLFEFLLNQLSGEYKLKDDYSELTSISSSNSPALRVSYFLPLKYQFWLSSGFEVSNHKLEYTEIDQKFTKNEPSFFAGVNYAF